MRELVVGSRGSALALTQTKQVIEMLREAHPDVTCRIEIIKTKGDKILDTPLAKIGDKGLFVKEIEQALLDRQIDFAVHSAKDLPADMPPGLMVAAYPQREDPSDALVSRAGILSELPQGAVVGTSSLRRKAQLLRARPDLAIVDLRGNLDTRLRKLDEDHFHAIILAAAGLKRLGLAGRVTELLSHDVCLPAAAQGSLAIQCREGDDVAELIASLDHAATRAAVVAERTLLMRLNAGCQTPVAALAVAAGAGVLEMRGMVSSLDGSDMIRGRAEGNADSPEELGNRLAEELLDAGAAKLLDCARKSPEPTDMGAA